MRRLRTAWVVVFSGLVLLLSAGAVLAYFVFNDRFAGSRLTSGWSDAAAVLRAVSSVSLGTVAAVVLLRRPANRVSVLLSFGAIALAVSDFCRNYGEFGLKEHGYLVVLGRVFVPPAPDVALWAWTWTWTLAVGSMTSLLFLVFPDGKLPSRRWRPAAVFTAAAVGALGLRAAFGPAPIPSRFEVPQLEFLGYGISFFGRVIEIVVLVFFVAIGVGALSIVARYRGADVVLRQQLRMFAFAAAVLAVTHLAVPVLHYAGVLIRPIEVGLEVLTPLTRVLVPAAIGIAIFRYRLFDIDFVINKTIAFAVLSLFITGAYVAITVGAGHLIGSTATTDRIVSVAALGVVAVGFEPLRNSTQRWADRVVYGERAEPYDVLARFSHELPTTLHVERALPAIAEAMANGLRARSADVHLYRADGTQHVVGWPAESRPALEEPDLSVPIEFRGSVIGRLEANKRRGEPVTREDRRLIRLLSKQGAAALNNVRLTMELEDRRRRLVQSSAQLRASRRRLITAQLEVRQSIERELRSRVAPHLRPIRDLVRRAEECARDDTARAIDVLEQAAVESDRALAELREIAHGIFTPLVRERGFVAALESQIRRMRAPVELRPVGELRTRRYDPAIESAAYACCLETIRQVATPLAITLTESDGDLEFRISGPTFSPLTELDQGHRQKLADRLEAVGGSLEITYGTDSSGVVVGRLPRYLERGHEPTRTTASASSAR